MAKKKKSTRGKSRKIEVEQARERGVFWPIAWSIILVILGVLILLGGFGTGGSLPVAMFKGVDSVLGAVAYLVPIALVYFAFHKIKHEEKKLPKAKLFSMLGLILFGASWLHTAFATIDPDTAEVTGGHGGSIGALVGNLALGALNKFMASTVFFVLSLVMLVIVLSIAWSTIWGLVTSLRSQREDDTDLNDLNARNEKPAGFQVNEGDDDAIEQRQPKKLSSFRNAAPKLTAKENHEALTTTRDANWQFPGMDLLVQKVEKPNAGNVEKNAELIRETFANFNIDVEMEGANIGPRVTQYTLKTSGNVKMAKIAAMDTNLAYDLAAPSIRIEAPIPGKRAVGIEVPNQQSAIVRISSLFQSDAWQKQRSDLSFVVGKDIAGTPVVADLAEMPHLLVAGQTKAGKSVLINTFLTSLLYRNSPADLKLILVDPKHVELAPYNDIPHLLTPVITEPEKCISALKWAVAEMERRYKALAEAGQRNIADYNARKKEEGMPQIVIVIDELADLMMMAARDVEALIVRIAQKARAVGIHLVLATQRPSVDVITGLIKANVPARIAFTVTSQVDSRTIIDGVGAEKLLGMGDMLFSTADMPRPRRVQGAFISTDETNRVTDFIRMQRPPEYDQEVISQPVQISNGRGGVVPDGGGGDDGDDDMWRDAVRVVIEGKKASTSLLQRRLRIGYGRAARLVEQMEEQGIVSHADGNRPREVLVRSLDEVFGGGESGEDDGFGNAPVQQPIDDYRVR